MIYGCIGEKLAHSFSAEIHGLLGSEPYELREIHPEGLGDFLRARDFRGVVDAEIGRASCRERVCQYV